MSLDSYMEVFMGSKLFVALSLLSLLVLTGCSSAARSVADDSEAFRAPEGENRSPYNRELDRQLYRSKY